MIIYTWHAVSCSVPRWLLACDLVFLREGVITVISELKEERQLYLYRKIIFLWLCYRPNISPLNVVACTTSIVSPPASVVVLDRTRKLTSRRSVLVFQLLCSEISCDKLDLSNKMFNGMVGFCCTSTERCDDLSCKNVKSK